MSRFEGSSITNHGELTAMNEQPSTSAVAVLKRLRDRHNVLVSGPPATGKSLLLGEVARWFLETPRPPHEPMAAVPFPRGAVVGIDEWLPSPERSDRKVFRTTFHQGTKLRDWLRGLVPVAGAGAMAFKVTNGVFYDALVHAESAGGASLVIVDEINRGPAVQVFGDTIVAMESDKRLDPAGERRQTTVPLRLLTDDGDFEERDVPHHLYLLAAMNRADTSVEPLDVAFLRRWDPFHLLPDTVLAMQYLGLADTDESASDNATAAVDVYAVLHRAWRAVNARISLSRGSEYQLGHGVLMWSANSPPEDLVGALEYSAVAWRRIREHVDELFFGDARTTAAVLNVDAVGNPYRLESTVFADAPVTQLVGPPDPEGNELYTLLRAVGSE